ncbi:2,3-bisphosphoglycerate-independent phosphoglycerate mutase [Patescibacteria group bacterium]|nr:2,3-bisphosphoglycerate-independent phosphoglycerate mutase [Patescibacteria group bacterium]
MINKSKTRQSVMLVILDGWGVAEPNQGNAIELANTPFFDFLKNKYPSTELCAHGTRVGLPKNQIGNSEAGHLNIGAGRIVEDDAVQINKSIKNTRFFKNPAFAEGIRYLKTNQSKVHLMGLITEENSAHSSPEHWLAMINLLRKQNIKEVFLHLFTDGRDSPQHQAVKILERFVKDFKENNHNSHFNNKIKVRIASVCGRFYAMDRKKKWESTEQAYDLLVLGKGRKARTAKQAIVQAYNRNETDEFISPTVITNHVNKPVALIDDNDLVVFMNLRSDRARELSKAFCQIEFNSQNPNSFKRKKIVDVFFIALTDFGPDLGDIRVAYPSIEVKDSLPIALTGLTQFYIAETEKYAHVTFFFNGGHAGQVANEEQKLIPSKDVKTYDVVPNMNSDIVCDEIINKIKDDHPDFIVVNFCDPDMIGHTGNLQAGIKSIEHLDVVLKKLVKNSQANNYTTIITADHGNIEKMIDLDTSEIHTSHTTNPVPFILVDEKFKTIKLRNKGKLSDIAPTILDIMKQDKPAKMTGKSLLI